MNLFGAKNFYSGLSLVANGAMNDIWLFVFIIFGIVFAFWIIEMLIGLFGNAENRNKDEINKKI